MKKLLILVTNDDGMFAPGIKALVEVVQELGEVVVIAPTSPQCGKVCNLNILSFLQEKKLSRSNRELNFA